MSHATTDDIGPAPGDQPAAPRPAMGWKEVWAAAALALVWLVLVNLFLLRYGLEGGKSYGLSTVPPSVPWFILFLMIAFSAGAARLSHHLALSRRQMVLVFGFLALAIPISCYGTVRALLPHLSLLPYFASPDNEFQRIASQIPDWLMPKSPQVIIPAYEGAANGQVMWGPWLRPVLLWSLFLAVIGLVNLCWIVMLRHRWNQGEHLSYPMIELPREMVGIHRRQGRSVLQDPLLWIGFALATILQVGSIMKNFVPSLPAMPLQNDLSRFFTEAPLTFLLPMRFNIDPQTIGAAYLVPGDILFSVWAVFLVYKLVGLVGGMAGLRDARFPYYQAQSTGGYIAYGLLLIYLAKDHVWRVVKQVWGGQDTSTREGAAGETWPLSPAVAVFGLLGGIAFIIVWCIVNQFALKLAVPYFSLLLIYTVVQVRIRAETGIPLAWDYPYNTQKAIFNQVLGTKGIEALGGEQGLVMLSYYSWLSRYNYLGEASSYMADNLTLWQETGVNSRRVIGYTVAAIVIGILIAFVIHLKAYYGMGALLLQAGALGGGAQTQVARGEYLGLSAQLISPAPPDFTRVRYIVVGAVIALSLAGLRKQFLRFPLHPLGFLMATCYGPNPYYWSSFLLAWLGKVLILRLGGAGLYRRALPFFLGLVLGQALIYDVLWMIIRALLPEGMVSSYI